MRRLLLLIVPLSCSAPPAFPWGCEGHRTIAMIALERLSPHARAAAASLLQSYTGDGAQKTACGPSGLAPFADLATWADDIREKRKETAPWHFIDIPLGASRDRMQDACPAASGCIVSALRDQLGALRAESTPGAQKAEALLFIIHFIGDLHQPLHAADNNDHGGNCVPVTFFDISPHESGSNGNFHPNLHSVWDTSLVDRIANNRDPAAFAAALSLEFGAEIDGWKTQGVKVDDWTWESHELAVDAVYGNLSKAIPVENPRPVETCADDNRVSERLNQLHEKIDQGYLRAVSPVIRRQLARAGTRLAMVLNNIWP